MGLSLLTFDVWSVRSGKKHNLVEDVRTPDCVGKLNRLRIPRDERKRERRKNERELATDSNVICASIEPLPSDSQLMSST
jgi:hypothetical protein